MKIKNIIYNLGYVGIALYLCATWFNLGLILVDIGLVLWTICVITRLIYWKEQNKLDNLLNVIMIALILFITIKELL